MNSLKQKATKIEMKHFDTSGSFLPQTPKGA